MLVITYATTLKSMKRNNPTVSNSNLLPVYPYPDFYFLNSFTIRFLNIE